jgi:Ras-related protein Rab-5C
VKELQRRGDPNVVIALAGNKADMEGKRKVQTEEAQQYAQENDIIFLETSAKTALNVRNLFVEIGKKQCQFDPFIVCERTLLLV